MSERVRVRATVLRPLILALTGLAVWGVLWVGHQSGTLEVGVGDLAPDTFVTERSLEIPDVAGTEAARAQAAAEVPDAFRIDETVVGVVTADIEGVFADARSGTVVSDPTLQEQIAEIESTTTTLPEPEATTTTTEAQPDPEPVAPEDAEQSDEPATTTTTIPSTADVTGQLFIDVNADAEFSDVEDKGVPEVLVAVTDSLGVEKVARTSSAGVFVVRDLAPGPAVVAIDASTVPETLTTDIERLTAEIDLVLSDTVEAPPVGFDAAIRDREAQIQDLTARYGSLEVNHCRALGRLRQRGCHPSGVWQLDLDGADRGRRHRARGRGTQQR